MVGMGFGRIGVGWDVLVCGGWTKWNNLYYFKFSPSRHTIYTYIFTFEAHDIPGIYVVLRERLS